MAAYRVHVHRKTGSSEHPLRLGGEIVFGRDPDCTVSLNDGQVSRRHAVLRLQSASASGSAANATIELVDLGSRNGSSVDGVRATANVPMNVLPTSVIRIGAALIVLEEARAGAGVGGGGAGEETQWCFDRASFEKRANEMLAIAKKTLTALLEIQWEADGTQTTTADAAAPASLQQMIVRIVGPQGLIGAHESGRLLLLIPDTDETRIDAMASLIRRVCDERALKADVRIASSMQARSIDVLIQQCTHAANNGGKALTAAALVPPVIFHGGLRSVDALLEKLDASEAPVLIVGETGVGKDVLARTLHGRSHRKNKPLVALNCAAFTEALFESELFGHERGAFTGANQAKSGLLESAAGGTVFLDEIGEMPLGMQAKLLRVVENREVLRVGALQPKQIDVRLIFATNRDLRQEIERKAFRSDLFFRIASITLTIPPLRERVDEIIPLTLHFIDVSSKRIGRPAPRLLPEARRFLESHSWPGNVRELKNVIDLAVLVSENDIIRPSDIHIERYIPSDARAPSSPKPNANANANVNAEAPMTSRSPGEPGLPKTERERMIDALEKSVWNQSEAAKLLGMPRRTFVKRLAQYEIPRPRKRE